MLGFDRVLMVIPSSCEELGYAHFGYCLDDDVSKYCESYSLPADGRSR